MQIRAMHLMPVVILACATEPEPGAGDAYTSETLAAYKRAIPEQSRLLATVPTAEDTPGALTSRGDAVLAAHGVDFARAVNRPVRALVATLRAITEQPPTRFDALERKFVWGPWNNERGVGQVLLVVRENEAGADFAYSYALVRTLGGELAEATAVISGAATPDAADSERGVGVTLWDLEADWLFESEHDPDHDGDRAGRGRFVTLFGHHERAEGDAAFNVAVFRDFVPEREPLATQSSEPIDVDYFYGRFIGQSGVRVDFVDSEVFADICEVSVETCFDEAAAAGSVERFDYSAFFVDRGLGRAEARLSEGDLGSSARFVECWDPSLRRTSFQIETEGEMVEMVENGSCSAPADQSATALGLPTLADIDPALLEVMSCAAQNGLIGCE